MIFLVGYRFSITLRGIGLRHPTLVLTKLLVSLRYSSSNSIFEAPGESMKSSNDVETECEAQPNPKRKQLSNEQRAAIVQSLLEYLTNKVNHDPNPNPI